MIVMGLFGMKSVKDFLILHARVLYFVNSMFETVKNELLQHPFLGCFIALTVTHSSGVTEFLLWSSITPLCSDSFITHHSLHIHYTFPKS